MFEIYFHGLSNLKIHVSGLQFYEKRREEVLVASFAVVVTWYVEKESNTGNRFWGLFSVFLMFMVSICVCSPRYITVIIVKLRFIDNGGYVETVFKPNKNKQNIA